MVDDVQFSILGLDSLLGKFESISYDVKRKGGRSALRKAAQLVANAAKENAQSLDDPETGRSIADNIALRWSRRRFDNTGDLMFRVGVLKGAKFTRGDQPKEAGAATPHWRLLEFGTANMPAQPFMRRALSDNIQTATNTFVTEYEKSVDRAIKRAAKKAGV
jgi:HK97 gp10 family phage protein